MAIASSSLSIDLWYSPIHQASRPSISQWPTWGECFVGGTNKRNLTTKCYFIPYLPGGWWWSKGRTTWMAEGGWFPPFRMRCQSHVPCGKISHPTQPDRMNSIPVVSDFRSSYFVTCSLLDNVDFSWDANANARVVKLWRFFFLGLLRLYPCFDILYFVGFRVAAWSLSSSPSCWHLLMIPNISRNREAISRIRSSLSSAPGQSIKTTLSLSGVYNWSQGNCLVKKLDRLSYVYLFVAILRFKKKWIFRN